MKKSDRILQDWRILKARPYLSTTSRVLDIGCADGALFRKLAGRFGEGVGIDPNAESVGPNEKYRLVKGTFPESLADEMPFDVITLLAVLEHIPRDRQSDFARACATYLRPGGLLVITVPSQFVDPILDALIALKIVDGMEEGQHYGFEPSQTAEIFCPAGFELVRRKRFQLGLNNLFVFKRNA